MTIFMIDDPIGPGLKRFFHRENHGVFVVVVVFR